ncbi:hypothetical protein BZG01_07275 [Labilibaculum manganireducens]|uniref:DUF5041 domain-containing protein n=1 Tax=Labilibaculum manganireducens TaxID=1940525 RepID=A0A2N3IB69_9BACT|nr:hypothetical protein [Labilibaculum manganireducens]PKQ67530.1 hypothetical protein BZG01_07275 [Labilibaculum manganireducens]
MKRLILFIATFLPIILNAQKLNKELESSDINEALNMMGVDIFKFDFDSVDLNYNLTLYLEEYIEDSIMIKKSFNMGKWSSDNIQKEIKLISKISSDTTKTFWFKIIHPNRQQTVRFDILPEFRSVHYWKEITADNIAYGKKTPLLFLGMAWEDSYNGMKIRRFCWGEDVKCDLKNETLKKIKHKILLSYQLEK